MIYRAEVYIASNLIIWNDSSENGGFIEKISIYSTKIYEGKDKSPRQDVATFLNMLNSGHLVTRHCLV